MSIPERFLNPTLKHAVHNHLKVNHFRRTNFHAHIILDANRVRIGWRGRGGMAGGEGVI